MGYIDQLINDCKAAKAATPTNVFELTDLSQLDGIEKAIYVIEDTGGEANKTYEQFRKFKEKGERKCSRLNHPSHIMYVGSSTTGVRKRIEQHLGHGHRGTYSLHLKHWFKGSHKITIKQYDVSKEVLQIIEDDLSQSLKPAFGKQGGNNK